MTPHHKERGQMFTREAVMYDDSNLNKNEFTAIVSFAVNFHFSRAQLMLRGHLPLALWLSHYPAFQVLGEKGETRRQGNGEKGVCSE